MLWACKNYFLWYKLVCTYYIMYYKNYSNTLKHYNTVIVFQIFNRHLPNRINVTGAIALILMQRHCIRTGNTNVENYRSLPALSWIVHTDVKQKEISSNTSGVDTDIFHPNCYISLHLIFHWNSLNIVKWRHLCVTKNVLTTLKYLFRSFCNFQNMKTWPLTNLFPLFCYVCYKNWLWSNAYYNILNI